MQLILILAIALMGFASGSAQTSNRGLIRPPADIRYETVEDRDYIKGIVYLNSHQDTALLKPFGFLNLQFESRGFRCVKYSALWPKETVLDSLPPQVSGVEYADVQIAETDDAPIYSLFPKEMLDEMGTSPHEMLQRLRPAIFSDAVPSDGSSDTTILGKPYLKGWILMTASADTSELKVLGFVGFVSLSKSVFGDIAGNAAMQHVLSPVFQFRCCWPLALDVNQLPNTVVGIKSDRAMQIAREERRKHR